MIMRSIRADTDLRARLVRSEMSFCLHFSSMNSSFKLRISEAKILSLVHFTMCDFPPFYLTFMFQPSITTSTHPHRVPDHNQLMMADSQCRVCGNILTSARTRRNHELTTHRLHIIDGETYSRTPYVMPLFGSSTASSAPAPMVQSSSTAASTPAPTVQSSSTPTSSILTSAVQTSSGSQSLTVSPALMSVASTGSSGAASLPTPTVSPALMSVASTGSLGAASLPTPTVSPALMSAASTGSSGAASLPAPNLFLTPSPGLRTTRRSTAASASPISRNVRPRLSTRSASVAPATPSSRQFPRASNDPNNRKCKYCLREFSCHAELNRHLRQNRCIFEFRPSDHNIANFCVLRRPPNYNQTAAILSQLTIKDKIRLCRLNSWAIPGLWPLVFPGNFRQRGQTPLILTEMTAAGESTNILRSLLRSEAQVQLPKQIILIDEASNIKSVLPTSVLTPGTAFVSRIAGDQLLVSSGNEFFLYQSST